MNSRSTTSSLGTVRSRGSLLGEWSCSGIGWSWKPGGSPRRPLTCVWPPVRRLAYEAADTGLLSPDLAAGVRRVKGAKRIGVRLGNWLTMEQSRALLQAPDAENLKGRRDRAILALVLGCGLRRGEVAGSRYNPKDFATIILFKTAIPAERRNIAPKLRVFSGRCLCSTSSAKRSVR